MPTSTVPCRAKDPNTCAYHGAQIRAEAALLRGDLNTWLTENTNMLAARNLAEVQDFIQSQTAETPQVDVDLGAADDEDDPYHLMARYWEMQGAIADRSRSMDSIGFAIGNPDDDDDPVVNRLHVAYQYTADVVLKNILDRNPDDHFLVASRDRVLQTLDSEAHKARTYSEWALADAYLKTRKEIQESTFAPNDEIDVRQALQNLTVGYDIEANKARIHAQ